MTLYVETNLILSAAFGRDSGIDDLLRVPPSQLLIALPAICVMEAWSAFEAERKRRGRFEEELNQQISQVRRDLTSSHARALLGHLEQAGIENANLLNDVARRLSETVASLAGVRAGCSPAEFIPLTREIAGQSLVHRVMDEPTDNLILTVILHHARQHPGETQALLTANSRDFDTSQVRAVLASARITEQFASAQAFLGWFRSQQPDDAVR